MFTKTFRMMLAVCFLLPALAWAQTYPSPTFNSLTLQTPLATASGGTGTTSTTGSGSAVFSTSPTLVTPALGTPSALTLTNATGLPLATGVTGTLPTANGGTGTTSTTGSGSLVFSTSPTLVTPVLGTPTSVNLANGTNLPVSSVTGMGTFVNNALTDNLSGSPQSIYGLVAVGSPIIYTPFISGVTNGSNAASGNVGEFVSANASAVSLTTTTVANVTSISLTAGDWDVSGGTLLNGSAANQSNSSCGYSTASATFGPVGTYGQQNAGSTNPVQAWATAIPVGRVNITSTTTVYLVCESVFSTGTVNASGVIQARRVR